jgi:hypothetical protein
MLLSVVIPVYNERNTRDAMQQAEETAELERLLTIGPNWQHRR